MTSNTRMDRRSFLKRLVLGAAAVLVAPTVIGKAAEAASRPKLAQSIDVQESNWGRGPAKNDAERESIAKTAEFMSGRHVPAGGGAGLPGVQPAPGASPLVGCCPALGGSFCNPQGCTNWGVLMQRMRDRSATFATTGTNITVPLTYGTFTTTGSTWLAPQLTWKSTSATT